MAGGGDHLGVGLAADGAGDGLFAFGFTAGCYGDAAVIPAVAGSGDGLGLSLAAAGAGEGLGALGFAAGLGGDLAAVEAVAGSGDGLGLSLAAAGAGEGLGALGFAAGLGGDLAAVEAVAGSGDGLGLSLAAAGAGEGLGALGFAAGLGGDLAVVPAVIAQTGILGFGVTAGGAAAALLTLGGAGGSLGLRPAAIAVRQLGNDRAGLDQCATAVADPVAGVALGGAGGLPGIFGGGGQVAAGFGQRAQDLITNVVVASLVGKLVVGGGDDAHQLSYDKVFVGGVQGHIGKAVGLGVAAIDKSGVLHIHGVHQQESVAEVDHFLQQVAYLQGLAVGGEAESPQGIVEPQHQHHRVGVVLPQSLQGIQCFKTVDHAFVQQVLQHDGQAFGALFAVFRAVFRDHLAAEGVDIVQQIFVGDVGFPVGGCAVQRAVHAAGHQRHTVQLEGDQISLGDGLGMGVDEFHSAGGIEAVLADHILGQTQLGGYLGGIALGGIDDRQAAGGDAAQGHIVGIILLVIDDGQGVSIELIVIFVITLAQAEGHRQLFQQILQIRRGSLGLRNSAEAQTQRQAQHHCADKEGAQLIHHNM